MWSNPLVILKFVILMDKDNLAINLDHIININLFENPEKLTCQTICHGILKDPIKCLDCNQHFCRDCITKWVFQDRKCPHCRKEFTEESADNAILSNLEKIRIRCLFQENGCKEETNYELLLAHLEFCGFRKKECIWCKKEGIKKEIDVHLSFCDLRLTTCQGCKKIFNVMQLESHDIIRCLNSKIEFLEKILIFKERLRFSTKMKNNSISLNLEKNHANQLTDLYRLSGVCILKPKLKKLKSWKIKVLSLTNWIGIGISTFHDIYSQNYTLSDYSIENMKHGGYMISSNGIKWSSTVKNQNFQGSFNFGQDDTIEIIYNPLENKIHFNKSNSYSESASSVWLTSHITEISNFYPIVVLGGVDDRVMIVSSVKLDLNS